MKNFKRILLTAVAAMLLMAVSVVGTLAYLNAVTEPVVNTFTYGNVNFVDLNGGLDEADVDKYGVEIEDAARVKANEYKLLPGHTYTKDPTVHIAPESEECWVFIKVLNGITGIEAENAENDDPDTEIDETKLTIAAQMEANGWVALPGEPNVYYYHEIVNTLDPDETDENPAQQLDLVIFETFTLKDELAEDGIENYTSAEIWIDAYLIQYDGLENVADAWAAANGAGFTK